MMKKSKIRVWAAAVLILLQCYVPIQAQAAVVSSRQEIRVGLTALYSGKNTLTINNKLLGYGYCVGNWYLEEIILESSSGFTFEPVNGYPVVETEVYGSYQAVRQAVEYYKKMGIEAYPGSVYQCTWRIYFGTADNYDEAEQLEKKLQELTGKKCFQVLSGSNYRIKMTGSFGTVFLDGGEEYAYPQLRSLTPDENGVCCVSLGERKYRGRIEIGRYNSTTLTAVNIVPLEEYLYGVVPAEMTSSWHEEALKAQAVCARSFALVKAGYGGASNAKKGYKIVDTVSSQVYKGYLAETVKTNRAVDATRGEMICYNNKVVPSYFFSSSGGRTEASKDVWAVDLPYLKSVTDFYEQNASRAVWQELLTFEKIEKLLEQQGLSVGTIKNLFVSKYSETNRVVALNVVSGKQSLTLQGTTIRTVLNLNSTKFKIVRKGDIPDQAAVKSAQGSTTGRISKMYVASADGVTRASEKLAQYIVKGADNLSNYPRTAPEKSNEVLFAGMGYGHGVGMSQYGAKGMAEAGYTYKEIIEYYFTGAGVR